MISLDKIHKLATLWEKILSAKSVSPLLVQNLIGQCLLFNIVVLAAMLFTREMNITVSKAAKNQKPIKITTALGDEIQHWRFLNNWTVPMIWRDERHLIPLDGDFI